MKLNVKLKDCSFMFYQCKNLINIDLSSFETKYVTNMSHMFYYCENLKNINLSSFDTKNVTNFNKMFFCYRNLKDINLSSFNTEKAINMSNIFFNCKNLIKIDLSSFDTKNVIDMSSMFACCNNIKNLDLSSFNTKNVTNMKFMFSNCHKLSDINLSSFDIKKVNNIKGIFQYCINLKKDYYNIILENSSSKDNFFFENLKVDYTIHNNKIIQNILIVKNEFIFVKSLKEITIYLISQKIPKFKIILNEEIEEKSQSCMFEDKLKLIEDNENTILKTNKFLIKIDLEQNNWKVINYLEKGEYI